MAIVQNKYNNPALGQSFENIASLFAPPSATDLAGYSTAALNRQKHSQLAQLFGAGANPSEQSSLIGVQDYGQTPVGFTYKVDEDNATSRANNLQTNQFNAISDMYPVLNPGQMRPAIPQEATDFMGLPAIGGEVQGNVKPMSEMEVKGSLIQQAIDDDLLSAIDAATQYKSGTNVEKVIDPETGKSVFITRDAAPGMEVAPSSPLVNIGPNGEPLGDPGKGLVWKRNPDGSVAMDDRGAPIAIPFEGGEVWTAEEEAAAKAAARDDRQITLGTVVVQDIDRALSMLEENPLFTAGMGAKAIGWWDGGPAANVRSLISSVQAVVGFDQLQQMREASPTGGALGPVSDIENKLLQSVLGSLSQEQSAEQLADNLRRVKNIFMDIVHGVGNGPRETLKFQTEADAERARELAAEQGKGGAPAPAAAPGAVPPAPVAPQTGPAAGAIEDGYRFNGGDPADPNNWSQVE